MEKEYMRLPISIKYNNMGKVINILLLVICCIGISSCRGNSSKKAIDLAQKYLGKTIKGTKKLHLEQHADDVARVKFVKISCTSCAGSGYVNNAKCENCGGDGWVYKVKRR